MSDLDRAWAWRLKRGLFKSKDPLRVFHGPGEGQEELRFFAVDRYEDCYWLTQWEPEITRKILTSDLKKSSKKALDTVIQFYREKGAISIVGLHRPERGIASEGEVFFGAPAPGRFVVRESESGFWIQFEKTRHPGLFLDHAPLRGWLKENVKGMRVLNTFAYTGSLSVASGLGGAKAVTTLDLSNTTLQWAKENWLLNPLKESSHRLIGGDVFEWLPRLRRDKEKFECVILDPPSFSRGKQGQFSTAKDLEKLHFLAMDLVVEGGLLITSINSANISLKKYEADVVAASRAKSMSWQVLKSLGLPETFPTRLGYESDRYLKGWILKRMD